MKEKLLHERALVTCIAMLFICIILKLFGVQWFDLNTDIPILQEIDKVVMNSVPLSFLYSFVLLFINGYLICSISNKTLNNNLYLLSLVCIISILLSNYLGNNILVLLFDIFGLYIVCYKKSNIKEYLITILLNIIYQTLSLFIRDLGYQIANYDVISSILFNLDYYILLVLTYLYLKKGDVTLCSISRRSFSYLATKLWKKRSENYSNKEGN